MRTACTKHMIEISEKVQEGFGPLVRAATEVGVVVPSLLETQLKKAGYTIQEQAGTNHGMWVTILSNNIPVAHAFSHNRSDAILQAVYAELKTGCGLQWQSLPSFKAATPMPKPSGLRRVWSTMQSWVS